MERERDDIGRLVRKVLGGDVEAFSRLVMPHQAGVRALIARLVPTPEDADDVAQEVFVAAFESLGSFKPNADFGKWLRGIARNHCRMLWRKYRTRSKYEKKIQDILKRAALDKMDEPDLDSDRKLGALRSCIDKLPKKNRAVIEMSYTLEMDKDEIAERLKTSANAVYTSLSRIRQALKRCVENFMEGAKA